MVEVHVGVRDLGAVRSAVSAHRSTASARQAVVQAVPVEPAAPAPASGDDTAAADPTDVAPDDAVLAQTINFNLPLALRLVLGPLFWWARARFRFWASFAWWIRLQTGEYKRDEFENYFNENAYRFGKKLRKHVPSHLKWRLGRLIDEEDEPFLVIRGIFSARLRWTAFTKALVTHPDHPTRRLVGTAAKALLEKDRCNLLASAVIAATKTELRRKLDQGGPYRDFITDTAAEINQFADGADMQLRYRTATPELPPATEGPNKTARVIVFACIDNPIGDPIYLIRVRDVIDELKRTAPVALDDLHNKKFVIFDRWSMPEVRMQLGPNPNECVLHRGPKGEDWLTFDPNRVCPDKIDADHTAALGALMQAIQTVAATKAREIVLRRGDALIVDNYRALTRRQAHGYAALEVRPSWLWGKPLVRWFRVYYGFPPRPEQDEKSGKEGTKQG